MLAAVGKNSWHYLQRPRAPPVFPHSVLTAAYKGNTSGVFVFRRRKKGSEVKSLTAECEVGNYTCVYLTGKPVPRNFGGLLFSLPGPLLKP